MSGLGTPSRGIQLLPCVLPLFALAPSAGAQPNLPQDPVEIVEEVEEEVEEEVPAQEEREKAKPGANEEPKFDPAPAALLVLLKKVSTAAPQGEPQHRIRPRVRFALDWLVEQQSETGYWTSVDLPEFARQSHKRHASTNDVGLTGLAMLAFLDAGSTLRVGPLRHRKALRRGAIWLLRQRDARGRIGQESGHSFLYSHAVASLALLQTMRLSKLEALRPAVQRAVEYAQSARNPYKVWRYYPKDGQNDSSVTGWMVKLLVAAKAAGCEVDAAALKASEAWFDEVTDPATGLVGYCRRSEPSSRMVGLERRFPSDQTRALTALGLCCQVWLGDEVAGNETLGRSVLRIQERIPELVQNKSNADHYFWLFGTIAMQRVGGEDWDRWRAGARLVLLQSQDLGEAKRGSWPADTAWGPAGGRVYTTALSVMTMQVLYGESTLYPKG